MVSPKLPLYLISAVMVMAIAVTAFSLDDPEGKEVGGRVNRGCKGLCECERQADTMMHILSDGMCVIRGKLVNIPLRDAENDWIYPNNFFFFVCTAHELSAVFLIRFDRCAFPQRLIKTESENYLPASTPCCLKKGHA